MSAFGGSGQGYHDSGLPICIMLDFYSAQEKKFCDHISNLRKVNA